MIWFVICPSLYISILAFWMVSPENQYCANCIGTLSSLFRRVAECRLIKSLPYMFYLNLCRMQYSNNFEITGLVVIGNWMLCVCVTGLKLFYSGGTFTFKFHFKIKMWFVIWFDLIWGKIIHDLRMWSEIWFVIWDKDFNLFLKRFVISHYDLISWFAHHCILVS